MDILQDYEVEELVPSAHRDWVPIFVQAANSIAGRHAPCLRAPDADLGLVAEAKIILLGAIERATQTKHWVRAETRGPFSISYITAGRGLLDTDDVTALKALCGGGGPALPQGAFPRRHDYEPLFARPNRRLL